MDIVTDILITAFGFILIIAVSYFLKEKGIFKTEYKVFLGNVLLNINLPCVIISGFKTFEYDNSLIMVIVLGIVISLFAILVGFIVSYKKEKPDKVLHMMTCAGYNIGIFTIPFVSSFLSSSALICTLMFDMGNAIMVFGTTSAITTAIVYKKKQNPIPAILKKLFTTIPFVTYLVVILTIALNIKIPSAVYKVTDIGSNMTAFLAMVMIGIMLELKIDVNDVKSVVSAILVRYLFATVMSLLIFSLSPFEYELKKALAIAIFSPLSTASLVFSQKAGCKGTTLGAFSSLSIIISMIVLIGIVVFV